MKITNKTIKKVASLARLKLSAEEIKTLMVDMENIITYVDRLNELDTQGVDPTNHIMSGKNVLREDEVNDSFDRDLIMKSAPIQQDGCYKVPKIVE